MRPHPKNPQTKAHKSLADITPFHSNDVAGHTVKVGSNYWLLVPNDQSVISDLRRSVRDWYSGVQQNWSAPGVRSQISDLGLGYRTHGG